MYSILNDKASVQAQDWWPISVEEVLVCLMKIEPSNMGIVHLSFRANYAGWPPSCAALGASIHPRIDRAQVINN